MKKIKEKILLRLGKTSGQVYRILRPSKKPWYRRTSVWIGVGATMVIAIFSYVTNPFVRFTIITDPINVVTYEQTHFNIQGDPSLLVKDGVFIRRLAVFKSGWHIFASKFSGGKKAARTSVDEIIQEIHMERFNPENPYLISGDHFSVFYPRSLGIFYHSLLDPRTALNELDWQQRQAIYLKSLAYALQAYDQSDRLSTTIVPVGPRSVALVNFYEYPSDTMYSLLYSLSVLKDASVLENYYRYQDLQSLDMSLQTEQATDQLLAQHQVSLKRQFQNYVDYVVDVESGLIRSDITLSSTKDVVKRQSAFYDNVILWRSYQMADELGLIELEDDFLPNLKQTIIDRFWLEKEGYFVEELTPQAIARAHYSSDWLIVLMSGFLDPYNDEEREYYVRSIEYIRRNALDQPFALQYQPDPRPEQNYLIPRIFAPNYASTAIWSNWGMEYIKILTILAQETGDELYLQEADQQVSAYAFNIKRYRGFPEVYNSDGDFFRQTIYKSVRRTGWVVSYEQAREMFLWTRENWDQFRVE